MRQGGDDPGAQVEPQVAHVPHAVLNVVAEDPKEEQVARDVQHAAVHKHGQQHGLKGGKGTDCAGD